MSNKVLILFVHPAIHKSRINKKLIEGLSQMEGVTFHPLYHFYPNFFIDVHREQKLLSEHDVIIFHHPFYWYSAPALLKEWIDLVLQHGWAYGKNGCALQGKKCFNVISTGGRKENYSRGEHNSVSLLDFLLPYRKTANLCKMEYYPPFVISGSHLMQPDTLQGYTLQYHQLLEGLVKDTWSSDSIHQCEWLNELFEKK